MLGLPVLKGGEGEIIGVLPGNICLTIYGIKYLTLARITNYFYFIFLFLYVSILN